MPNTPIYTNQPGGTGGGGGPVGGAGPYTPSGTPQTGPSQSNNPGLPDPPTPPYVPTEADYAWLRTTLDQLGLGMLYDQAVEWMIAGVFEDEDRLYFALRNTDEFRTRFAGMFAREANGLPPISVNDYLAYENQAFQLMRAYGYPPGFYDQTSDFAELIGNNVSSVELEQRLSLYADAAAVGREQVRAQFAAHLGEDPGLDGITDAELAAWLIDPDRGLQALRQRMQAAQVSSAAIGSGFGALSFDEASRLTGAGVDEGQALQAFGALAQQGDVTGRLAGESEAAFSREMQIAVAAGDATAIAELERRRRQRLGGFSGGGGFASGREGLSGVGSAR